MTRPVSWDREQERGSLVGIRIAVGAYRLIGRWLGVVLTEIVVAYFFATDAAGRRASQRYLTRIFATADGRAALGTARPPGLSTVWRHYRSFGRSILDRVELWLGRGAALDVEFEGHQHLRGLIDAGRGALLLGAHLGSFDVLRQLAGQRGVPLSVLMYTRHAARINAVLRQLSPDAALRVIELDPHSFEALLEVRRCIERGEFVAIHADRAAPGGRGRSVVAPFLGDPAPFPEGPFQLASVLGCPIVLLLGMRSGERRFSAYAEVLSDGEVVPRPQRAARTQDLAERYAERLDHHCRAFPLQWFNFFDFWEEERAARS